MSETRLRRRDGADQRACRIGRGMPAVAARIVFRDFHGYESRIAPQLR